jgi:glyoxylase-like metal-dependent hydrolase (beta-lactamase superfamily II)
MIDIYSHINSIFTSITYILSVPDEPAVWLIDCGDADDIIEWIKNNEKTISGIFLTHTHYDHMYGLNALKKIYPGIKVYTSKEGIEGLYSSKLNMSYYYDEIEDFTYAFDSAIELKQSDVIQLWSNIELEVIETPGHDWSCLTYRIDKYLFTGDSYIPGIKTVVNFPKSNKKDANISIQKIIDLKEKNILIIRSGHLVEHSQE